MKATMKLAPCPFCGATIQVELDDSFFARCFNQYAVNCHECDATGPLESTKKEAIKAWNRCAKCGQRLKIIEVPE